MTASRSYFIAGTDTEIGKTYATCALLHHARGAGLRALGMKPVAAGARTIDGGLRNDDAMALIGASSFASDYRLVNPICLAEAVAPHIAAADEGRTIDPAVILAARDALSAHADVLLIEGVGGFRVPLQRDFDTADLATELAAPVILVVGLRLGCINHALLTADAIRARGLDLVGWIANAVDPLMSRREENVAALDERLGCRRLGVLPHDEARDPASAAGLLSLPAPPREAAAGAIVLIDSAARLHGGHRGRVVVTGSHGGRSTARHALRAGARLCFFNDAGRGKDDAGVAALAMLQRAGLAAACYSHDSACLGDARDGFGNGYITVVNDAAAAMGLRVGMSVVEAASLAAHPGTGED